MNETPSAPQKLQKVGKELTPVGLVTGKSAEAYRLLAFDYDTLKKNLDRWKRTSAEY